MGRGNGSIGKQNRIPDHQRQEIFSRFEQCRKEGMALTASYKRVGEEVGRSMSVIASVIYATRSTVPAARIWLRSKAMRMARKIVKDGNVGEMIDVLSRPSIGVLDPPTKAGHDGSGGFFLSVSADTCGAVKVAVATGQQAQLPAASAESFDPYALQPGDESYAPRQEVQRYVGRRKTTQVAIEEARIRLLNARRRTEDGGL